MDDDMLLRVIVTYLAAMAGGCFLMEGSGVTVGLVDERLTNLAFSLDFSDVPLDIFFTITASQVSEDTSCLEARNRWGFQGWARPSESPMIVRFGELPRGMIEVDPPLRPFNPECIYDLSVSTGGPNGSLRFSIGQDDSGDAIAVPLVGY